MRLEDLPLIYCLTCNFVALEDSESKESEVDAEEKETGPGEKADCATVSSTFLSDTCFGLETVVNVIDLGWKKTRLQSIFRECYLLLLI